MTRITLLDGGTGRELKRIGAPFRQPEWSALALIEAPEFVRQVHAAYVAAGADVITTNSYAVVPFHIGAARFAAQGAALAALAGRLAREAAAAAAARRRAVAGSLPPICGSYRADWFDASVARPVLATLVGALRPYVDHWQAETLSAIEEAELVREVVGDDGKPLWISYTLEDARRSPPSRACARGRVSPTRSRRRCGSARRRCCSTAASLRSWGRRCGPRVRHSTGLAPQRPACASASTRTLSRRRARTPKPTRPCSTSVPTSRRPATSAGPRTGSAAAQRSSAAAAASARNTSRRCGRAV